MRDTTDLLKKQLEEISQLRNLPNAEHPNFKQWLQLTTAIIEKKLGKEKKDEFAWIQFWSNRIGPWSEEELKSALNEGLNSAEAFLKALIQEIEILGEGKTEDLTKRLPSSKTMPKLKFGQPGKAGRPGSGGSIFIQAENFTLSGSGRISADGGDNIVRLNELTNLGTINQTTVNTINNVTKLTQLVSKSNLSEGEKRQLIGDIETIKAQIIKPEPDKTVLQKAWDAVQVVSKIGGAAQLLEIIGKAVLPLLK